MNCEVAYRFPQARFASRFLAELQAGAVGECRCRRHTDDHSILVLYRLAPAESFSPMAQKLDDLAETLGGSECSV